MENKRYNELHIYCDGGARGNGDSECKSAWASILFDPKMNPIASVGNFDRGKTNNQMELNGLIASIKLVEYAFVAGKSSIFKIYCDSHYTVEGYNNWMHNWVHDGVIDEKANSEYWKYLYALKMKLKFYPGLQVEVIEVRGHANNEGNNIVDGLVNKLMDRQKRTHILCSDSWITGAPNIINDLSSTSTLTTTVGEIAEIDEIINYKISGDSILLERKNNRPSGNKRYIKIPQKIIKSLVNLVMMKDKPILKRNLDGTYVCPQCGAHMKSDEDGLICDICGYIYNE